MAKVCPLSMTPGEIIEYTPEWEGERTPDGRPRVPDSILERMVRLLASLENLRNGCSVCL